MIDLSIPKCDISQLTMSKGPILWDLMDLIKVALPKGLGYGNEKSMKLRGEGVWTKGRALFTLNAAD